MAKKGSCNYSVEFKKLCTPAMIYFLVSTFGLFLIGLQNLNGNNNVFCLGSFKCSVTDKITVMLFHVVYILFTLNVTFNVTCFTFIFTFSVTCF